jgi:dienelactone hydrolase
MKSIALLLAFSAILPAQTPAYPRPLRELNTSDFPFNTAAWNLPGGFARQKTATRDRILLAAGLLPLPDKTPLNPVIHGRIERDDYTIDRVFFESFPGFYVTGSLYRPKTPPNTPMPGILCPHGHWPKGRFMDTGENTPEANLQLATGAERFASAARNPLQARCVQLARMGCAAFLYDMLGNADSIQIPEHRSGRREALNGPVPGTYALYALAAEQRLQSNFGLQTWNSIRALDFLLTLPNIDPARLGITGASGGGTQSLVLAAIDDRLAAEFPCVMPSTAMQGGCTCENANYLRIGQGNIDIAAAFAPKPYGMTAADDWTKELETKGWPDLQRVWRELGNPDNVEAHFNLHFPHNYNHVSRAQMYQFFNKHFKLGLPSPVLERDFQFADETETTVWTTAHPKPTDPNIEAKLLKHWSEANDQALKADPAALAKAWQLILARPLPAAADVAFAPADRTGRDTYILAKGTTRYARENEEITTTFFVPKSDWNGTAIIWLTKQQPDAPDAAMQKLLAAGCAIALPNLYLNGTGQVPWNPVGKPGKPLPDNDPFQSACFTYGYNHPLAVRRAHDILTTFVLIKNHEKQPRKIILASSEGMAAAGTLAAVALTGLLDAAIIDTQGFRFHPLTSVGDPDFIPGAVKYGDLPALLDLCDKSKTTLLGEPNTPTGPEALTTAILKQL